MSKITTVLDAKFPRNAHLSQLHNLVEEVADKAHALLAHHGGSRVQVSISLELQNDQGNPISPGSAFVTAFGRVSQVRGKSLVLEYGFNGAQTVTVPLSVCQGMPKVNDQNIQVRKWWAVKAGVPAK